MEMENVFGRFQFRLLFPIEIILSYVHCSVRIFCGYGAYCMACRILAPWTKDQTFTPCSGSAEL